MTVNTHNRLITDTTVSKELWICHTQLGLSLADIKRIIMNGVKAAFLPFHVKQTLVRRIMKELVSFNDDGTQAQSETSAEHPPALQDKTADPSVTSTVS